MARLDFAGLRTCHKKAETFDRWMYSFRNKNNKTTQGKEPLDNVMDFNEKVAL